jgi:hypothetical protein
MPLFETASDFCNAWWFFPKPEVRGLLSIPVALHLKIMGHNVHISLE